MLDESALLSIVIIILVIYIIWSQYEIFMKKMYHNHKAKQAKPHRKPMRRHEAAPSSCGHAAAPQRQHMEKHDEDDEQDDEDYQTFSAKQELGKDMFKSQKNFIAESGIDSYVPAGRLIEESHVNDSNWIGRVDINRRDPYKMAKQLGIDQQEGQMSVHSIDAKDYLN